MIDYAIEFEKRHKRVKLFTQSGLTRYELHNYYKKRPIEFIEHWCFTLDPRNENMRDAPFILFPRQKEYILFLEECRLYQWQGLVEKTRDAGISWLSIAYAVWLWLFYPFSIIGFGSRKEALVDNIGDDKSLLEKARHILDRLPKFILPLGYSRKKHAVFMKIKNPVNGSLIAGEAGDNIGRGGRSTIYFVDEAAFIEHPDLIYSALSANTNTLIDISSVNGTASSFYTRRMAGVEWIRENKEKDDGSRKVFIYDWRDDPRKTQEWYDLKRKQYEKDGKLFMFASEYERDYSGSQDRVIIESKWIEAAIDVHIKLNIPVSGAVLAGQDVADGGGDKNAIAIRHGFLLKHIEHWGGSAGDASRIAYNRCLEHNVNTLYYDAVGVGSGFKEGWNGLPPNNIRITPYNGGSSPLNPTKHIIPNDRTSRTNEDFYANLKAQSWWNLRTKFCKTYEAIYNNIPVTEDDIISLPSNLANLEELKRELSQPLHGYTATGKVMVDKKPNGSSSPNLADAVAMCYTPLKRNGFL